MMAKFKQFTNEERRAIIKMKESGKTYRELAVFWNKTPAAIYKIIRAFKEVGRISIGARSGRPKVTDKRTDLRIRTISESDPHLSVPKIRAKLIKEGKRVPTDQTIRRRLHAIGMHGRVARKLPYMSKANIKKRMQFYCRHVLKPPEFWNRILWTDESMIRLTHSHGRMFVWRAKGEMLSYKCAKPTLKSIQRGVMVWGCISCYGIGKIVLLEGKVNSDVYLNLLKDVIIPEGNRLIGNDFILQQDNAPIHKAKKVMEHLNNNNIELLEWPPQSPDLSPIENVWAWLKMKISEKCPRNINELKSSIAETWLTFTVEDCRKYTLSLPDRISMMSQRNGQHCGY